MANTLYCQRNGFIMVKTVRNIMLEIHNIQGKALSDLTTSFVK